jgi:hypothetical protein
MTFTMGFKPGLDIPQWRYEGNIINSLTAGGTIVSDDRNDATSNPYLYSLASASALSKFNPITSEWLPLSSPGLAGTFSSGATAIFHAGQNNTGILASGNTATKIVLSTALVSSVAPNQLANRGDSFGYRVRVISPSAGKTEERTIIGNTPGTTPTILLDSALSFAPSAGDTYEILAGRVFLLSSGTVAAGVWKYYDIATNSYSGNLSTTNLPATIGTSSSGIALAETYVPYNRNPGEGFVSGGATSDGKNCIQATAATSTTITGSGMPSDLQANEYSNFQVRVIADPVTPTSVGQRRKITSHTAGATGVFTVSAFTVTPSSSAIFVVENNNDQIILRTSATTTTYTYTCSANAWDTTSYGAAPANNGTNCYLMQSFGIARDVLNVCRNSYCYFFRGGGSSSIDYLDIATATWTGSITYGNQSGNLTFNTGSAYGYMGATEKGRFIHINQNASNHMYEFDIQNRVMNTGTYQPYPQSTATDGNRLAAWTYIEDASKISAIVMPLNSSSVVVSMFKQGY